MEGRVAEGTGEKEREAETERRPGGRGGVGEEKKEGHSAGDGDEVWAKEQMGSDLGSYP